MMWSNGTGCFGGGLPMMIGMLLFWGLVIGLIVYVVRKSSTTGSNGHHNAVNLLKNRYSMGEISTEEYRERLQELLKK